VGRRRDEWSANEGLPWCPGERWRRYSVIRIVLVGTGPAPIVLRLARRHWPTLRGGPMRKHRGQSKYVEWRRRLSPPGALISLVVPTANRGQVLKHRRGGRRTAVTKRWIPAPRATCAWFQQRWLRIAQQLQGPRLAQMRCHRLGGCAISRLAPDGQGCPAATAKCGQQASLEMKSTWHTLR
jgi:hypothetical protein